MKVRSPNLLSGFRTLAGVFWAFRFQTLSLEFHKTRQTHEEMRCFHTSNCQCAFISLQTNDLFCLLTFNSESVSLNFSLHRFFPSIRVVHLHFERVHVSAFFLKNLFDLSVPNRFEIELALTCLDLCLKFVDLLQQRKPLVFFLSESTLKISPVLLLVHCDCLESLQLFHYLVSLFWKGLELLWLILELSGQMVNMSFKRQNFINKVLLFLVELLQLIVPTTQVSICVLNLNIKVPVFYG